jgi:hypothetical protein
MKPRARINRDPRILIVNKRQLVCLELIQTLGQFIVERRKELKLAGREVVAEVRNSDGKLISIPFLVDLDHDRRKSSDEVLEQLAKVLKVDSDVRESDPQGGGSTWNDLHGGRLG